MNPSLVRNIIYPAYRFVRNDQVFETVKELEKNQWLSRQELRDLQWKKLKLMLEYAYKYVPFYTQLFDEAAMKPEDIRSYDDYLKIPVLTKEIIRSNGKRMLSNDPSGKGEASNTGGSTGETLYFYKDLKYSHYNKANLIRLNRWCGIDIGDKEAVFWGTPFDADRINMLTEKIKMYMKNVSHLSTFDMSDEKIREYIKILRSLKPSLLRGYPSALFLFADFLKKSNIRDIKPKAVISTGEKSFPFQKELMAEVFGDVIFERYGSNEFGNIAHECDNHHGMHIISDMYYVEALKDNKPAGKGEAGEIVVTSLHNHYMPFLRYRIGDMGVLSDAQCSCGRGLPLMERIEGRSFDVITAPSGKVLGGFFWTFISRAVKGIKQFQIVQRQKNRVEFKIVPDETFQEESTKVLEREIKEKAGHDFNVDFKIVDSIPLSPSGKFRFIASDIARERMAMKSKVHKAVVTDTDLCAFDSVTIDEELMEKAKLKEYEKVLVVSNTTGARLETLVVKGKRGSGIISMNGATMYHVKKGQEIIIMSFAWTDEEIKPQAILVNEKNKFVQYLEGGEF